MKKRQAEERDATKQQQARSQSEGLPVLRVHLPGFLIEKEAGLGDLIKKATHYVGIKPCRGCQKRAAAMNRWMSFYR